MMYKILRARFAAPLSLLACFTVSTANAQSTGSQAGVAAAVRGNVTLVTTYAPQAGRVVGETMGSGDKVFLGDSIETGLNSGMQIMLLDETIFTIGPDAGMVIDEFVYDPATSTGQVAASVVKGAFRFVSGRVAKKNPQKMSVRTPVGTIGIRGTSAAGFVGPPDANGDRSTTVVLLGPGANNNANERAGRITVSNGGTSVEITRSGFGTTIIGLNGTPTPAVRFEPAAVAALTGDLGTNGGARPANNGPGNGSGQGSGQGGNGSSGGPPQGAQSLAASGQNLGASGTAAGFTGSFGGTQSTADDAIETAAETVDTFSAITSFDQLRAIQTGTASFNFSTMPLTHVSGPNTNSSGFVSPSLDIDFGAKTLHLVIATSYTFAGVADPTPFVFNNAAGTGTSYAASQGAAVNTFNSVDHAADFTTPPAVGIRVDITSQILNNQNAGEVAAQASLSVRVDNGTDVISGSEVADVH